LVVQGKQIEIKFHKTPLNRVYAGIDTIFVPACIILLCTYP
jgi:hypothetical protein